MIGVQFRKLLAQVSIQLLIENLADSLKTTIFVSDLQGNILWGRFSSDLSCQYPVTINADIIGWIHGDTKAQIIAQTLSYIAYQEFEKKTIAIETLEKYEEINFLYEISAKMSRALTIEDIIEVVIEETQKLIEVSDISFMLIDPKGELEIFYKHDEQIIKTIGTISSIYGHVLRSGKAEIFNDVLKDPRYIEEDSAIRSLICAPLKISNETIGVIKVSHIEPNSYNTEDLKLFTALTSQAAAAIKTAQYYEELKKYSHVLEQKVAERTLELKNANCKLKYLVTVDELTQINNRRSFNEYLEREWRRSTRQRCPLSLILCDVDYFKLFNDYYHHQAGDECLLKIAQTIKKLVNRPADLAARFGGEEFAIILSNTNELGAERVAQKICQGIEDLKIPHTRSRCSSYVTVSLGIATTVPTSNVTPKTLIEAADNALYDAKQKGRNCYSIETFRPKQL